MTRAIRYNVGASAGAAPEVAVPAGWVVTFEDYFTGSAVDTTKWNVRDATSNSNEQSYLLASNATVSGGYLSLTARVQSIGGKSYSSAYIDSIGKFSQRGGRWAIRCKLPTVPGVSQGLWPAPLWLRGDTSPMEVDVVESWGEDAVPLNGYRSGSASSSIHQNTAGGGGKVSGWLSDVADPDLSDDFHLYECIWEADGASPYVAILVDGVEKVRATPANAPWITGADYAGAANMRVNFQISKDGAYYGGPNGNTDFPATLLIDYIRVYRRA